MPATRESEETSGEASRPLVPLHRGVRSGKLLRLTGLILAAGGSVSLSLLIGFLARATWTDYRAPFLVLLPFAALNAVLVDLVWRSKWRALTWIVAGPAILGLLSYLEMASRAL